MSPSFCFFELIRFNVSAIFISKFPFSDSDDALFSVFVFLMSLAAVLAPDQCAATLNRIFHLLMQIIGEHDPADPKVDFDQHAVVGQAMHDVRFL
jgi:hypothetical protein